jgi:hypothetical protein
MPDVVMCWGKKLPKEGVFAALTGKGSPLLFDDHLVVAIKRSHAIAFG